MAKPSRRTPFVVLLLMAGITGVPLAGQKAVPRAPKASPADYPAGPPFTVDNLLELLSGVKRNILTEERLMMGLRKRGVDFPATNDSLSRLVDAGASETVLGILWKLSAAVQPSPAPPPPPKPALGMLLKCNPAECEVRINDRPFQTTKEGRALVEGLDPGRTIVDFRKNGFDPRTDVVDIPASNSGTAPAHEVSLHPTEETQRLWGQKLIEGMRRNVTAVAIPRTLTGTLKISNGAVPISDVVIRFETSGIANIEIQSAVGRASITCLFARCLPSSRSFFSRQKAELRPGKQLKAEEVEGYIPDLEAFLIYEFGETLSRLTDANSVPASLIEPSVASGPKTIRVANAAGTYSVDLGGDMKPSTLEYDSTTGVGPTGARVIYSDYQKIGEVDYPSTTQLKLGGDKRSILFQARGLAGSSASGSTNSPASK
jgi:hypothetical protein